MHVRTPRLRAVLFDLDGVLVDSYRAWRAVLDDAVLAFGGRPVTDAAFDAAWGQSVADDVRAFLPQVPAARLQEFYVENFARRSGRARVLDGAAEALDACRARGLRTACVTNAPRSVA